MAKDKKVVTQKPEKKVYADGLGEIKNPSKSVFGKILIWILAFLMFGSILITAIYYIIQFIQM